MVPAPAELKLAALICTVATPSESVSTSAAGFKFTKFALTEKLTLELGTTLPVASFSVALANTAPAALTELVDEPDPSTKLKANEAPVT